MAEADVHLPRPGDRCPATRHRRDLLVPEVQIDDALASACRCSVRERDILIEAPDLHAQNTAPVVRVFGDRPSLAQPAIEAEDDPAKPGMGPRQAASGEGIRRHLAPPMIESRNPPEASPVFQEGRGPSLPVRSAILHQNCTLLIGGWLASIRPRSAPEP